MEAVLTYRGRPVSSSDVEFIRQLIADNPDVSRRKLSKKLCEAWDWRQENGHLRDMVCRSLMLALHRAGHIELPPVRCRPPNPLASRSRPAEVTTDETPVEMSLRQLGQLDLRQVRRTQHEALFNGLIEKYHYLGYTQPVGEHLKYLLFVKDRPIACFAWSSAPRHLGPRDRFIGWSPQARRRKIRFLAYNTRFLILPWVRVPHLASHLLGRIVRTISSDWEALYDHPIYFVETFIDPTRFKGTCYRAANWIDLGQTTGRGKDDHTKRPNRPRKDILVYPLTRHFRQLLCE